MKRRGFGRGIVPFVAMASVIAASLGISIATGAPAGAAVVNDEPGFRSAWTTGATTKIDLQANITLTCTDVATGNGVSIRNSTTPIVVDGHGFSITQTCRTGPNNGVLEQDADGDVTLQNITITGGQTANPGGGVNMLPFTLGTHNLTVVNSTIAGNESACSVGGGLYLQSTGVMTMQGSTLTGNITDVNEGSAADEDGGTMLVVDSTVTKNKTTQSGALAQDSGTLKLVYATVVANTIDTTLTPPFPCVGSVKGATAHKVHGRGLTDVANVAPFNNFSSFGSVIAKPIGVGTTGTPAAVNCGNFNASPAPSQGYNYADDTSCAFTGTGDSQSTGNDPKLGPLAGNGGPTQTLLPLTGSPLIDGVPLAACQADGAAGIAIDQRGITRPQIRGCDIGAVEVVAPTPIVVTPRFTG
jgi:hypothetical protein